NLLAHDYWNEFCQHATASFAGGPATAAVLSKLAKLSSSVGVSAVILPGPIANPVSEDWFLFVENMMAEAPDHFTQRDYFATVALSSDALRDEVQVESVVERVANW